MMGSGAPNIAAPKSSQSSMGGMGGDNMGLFGMVSNLFGSLNSDPISSEMPSYQQSNFSNKSANDVDNIINDVHNNISVEDDLDNRIETLSVSDEEITSIIEDTADIQILKKSGKKGANTRTLNI
jgi:hypothetical protein